MYTHLLLILTVQISRAYCSFSIIIYLLYQNKCFVVFYEFEQICSNVQFIPSPIGEGILATVVKLFTQQKNPGNLTVPGYLTFGHNVPCGTQYI